MAELRGVVCEREGADYCVETVGLRAETTETTARDAIVRDARASERAREIERA